MNLTGHWYLLHSLLKKVYGRVGGDTDTVWCGEGEDGGMGEREGGRGREREGEGGRGREREGGRERASEQGGEVWWNLS